MPRLQYKIKLDSVTIYLKLDSGVKAELYMSSHKNTDLSQYGAELHAKKDVYYINSVKVPPEYRTQGYGSKLVKGAIRWARKNKKLLILDAIPLDTDIHPVRLKKFYTRFGFRLVDKKDPFCTAMIQTTL